MNLNEYSMNINKCSINVNKCSMILNECLMNLNKYLKNFFILNNRHCLCQRCFRDYINSDN